MYDPSAPVQPIPGRQRRVIRDKTVFYPQVEKLPQLSVIDAPEVVGHVCINIEG
jgi:hypothetical protein